MMRLIIEVPEPGNGTPITDEADYEFLARQRREVIEAILTKAYGHIGPVKVLIDDRPDN